MIKTIFKNAEVQALKTTNCLEDYNTLCQATNYLYSTLMLTRVDEE